MTWEEPAFSVADVDVELERLVLGVPLVRPEVLDALMEQTQADYFAHPSHRIVYESILALYERGEDVNFTTLTDDLQRKGLLEQVGGLEYLERFLEFPRSLDYGHYLKRFIQQAHRRWLAQLLERYRDLCMDPERTPEQVAGELEAEIARIMRVATPRGLRPVRQPLIELWKYLEQLHQSDRRIIGYPTGFARLDELTSGFQPGDFIVIAGRPGMGKTAFALNLALNLARQHLKVAFFSLEMSAMQLLQRLLSSLARIDLQRIRTAELRPEEWLRMAEAVSQLTNLPLYVDDTAGLSVQELRARARRQRQEAGLDVVFVDYLQLLTVRGRVENRQQEVSLISRHLKELAKELNVPVVALSQLSRRPEQREDARPQLADLRESGSIEQDADLVVFIYREEVYKPDTPRTGEAEIIIAKQRNGPTETVRLAFHRNFQLFENVYE
ncbi:Replicative DNA helicase [bacterium HR11]|nr:Replicative DNA helicase [bacterium HR11]